MTDVFKRWTSGQRMSLVFRLLNATLLIVLLAFVLR